MQAVDRYLHTVCVSDNQDPPRVSPDSLGFLAIELANASSVSIGFPLSLHSSLSRNVVVIALGGSLSNRVLSYSITFQ